MLIQGETGTGKSRLARQIHAGSTRAAGPLVEVNCAGLTSELVQSELFGHARGSFTGAHESRGGLLEAAHSGTIFMDEIGDMDLRVQPKLLKVIEEKRFRRVGDLRERSVDVRFIAATHANLLDAVDQKTFRQDLYYRVSTVTVVLPPLRERRDELVAIATGMLEQLVGAGRVMLSAAAAAVLLEYSWPGNLRELKNVIERAAVCRRTDVILPADLRFDPVRPGPLSSFAPPPVSQVVPASPLLSTRAGLASRREVEREHIRLALDAEAGSIRAAARRLGIARSTLYLKLREHGLLAS